MPTFEDFAYLSNLVYSSGTRRKGFENLFCLSVHHSSIFSLEGRLDGLPLRVSD